MAAKNSEPEREIASRMIRFVVCSNRDVSPTEGLVNRPYIVLSLAHELLTEIFRDPRVGQKSHCDFVEARLVHKGAPQLAT